MNIKSILKKIPFLQKTRIEFSNFLIYLNWKSKKSNINFPTQTKEQVDEFSKNGVLKINKNFSDFSNYLNENYVAKENIEKSTTYIHLPLDDSKVLEFIFDSSCDILNAFYGSEPYLREEPQIVIHTPKEDWINQGNGLFHVDRFNQISLMLLLHDTDLNSTHMEYLKTSHKRKFGFWDMEKREKLKDLEYKQKNNSYLPNNKFHLTGKKGDVFLFNSMGIHRANFINNSDRSVLFVNFTNGHNLYEYQNKPNENLKSDNSETILRKKENLVYVKGNRHTYFNNKFIFKFFQIH